MLSLFLVGVLALAAGLLLGRSRSARPASRRDLHSRLAAEAFPNGALLLFDRRLRHTNHVALRWGRPRRDAPRAGAVATLARTDNAALPLVRAATAGGERP